MNAAAGASGAIHDPCRSCFGRHYDVIPPGATEPFVRSPVRERSRSPSLSGTVARSRLTVFQNNYEEPSLGPRNASADSAVIDWKGTTPAARSLCTACACFADSPSPGQRGATPPMHRHGLSRRVAPDGRHRRRGGLDRNYFGAGTQARRRRSIGPGSSAACANSAPWGWGAREVHDGTSLRSGAGGASDRGARVLSPATAGAEPAVLPGAGSGAVLARWCDPPHTGVPPGEIREDAVRPAMAPVRAADRQPGQGIVQGPLL